MFFLQHYIKLISLHYIANMLKKFMIWADIPKDNIVASEFRNQNLTGVIFMDLLRSIWRTNKWRAAIRWKTYSPSTGWCYTQLRPENRHWLDQHYPEKWFSQRSEWFPRKIAGQFILPNSSLTPAVELILAITLKNDTQIFEISNTAFPSRSQILDPNKKL